MVKCPNCGNDIWEIRSWKNEAACSNCHYTRPYHTRKRGTEQTPSQTLKLEKIIRWFEKNRCWGGETVTTERSMSKGLLFVRVHTSNSIFMDEGAHIMIGRRGGITVLGTYGLGDSGRTMNHYARMLDGKAYQY